MIRIFYLTCASLLLGLNLQTANAADIKPCVGNSEYYEVLEPCTNLIENHDNGSDKLSQSELIWVINSRGRAWHWHGEYDNLSKDIDRALSIDPNNVSTLYNRYLLRDENEEWELSLSDITKVIEGNYGDMADNLYERAQTYNALDRYEEAIVDLDKALKINSNDPYIYYTRSVAHLELENYELGISDLTKFIAAYPEDDDAYYDRAYAYRDIDEYEKMMVDAKKNLEFNEDESSAYNLLGNAQRRNDLPEAALKSFAKALELDPSYDSAFYNIGLVHKDNEQFEEAAKAFEQSLELDPDYSETYLKLVEIYQELKQYDKVTQLFEKLSEIDPDNEDAKDAKNEFDERQNSWSCKWLSQC